MKKITKQEAFDALNTFYCVGDPVNILSQFIKQQGEVDVLPDCMMPDGADPCKGYAQLLEKYRRVRKELDETKAEQQ